MFFPAEFRSSSIGKSVFNETLLPEFVRIVPGWHVITSNLKKLGSISCWVGRNQGICFSHGGLVILSSVNIKAPYSILLYFVGSVGDWAGMAGIDHHDNGKWTMNEEC